VWGGVALAAIAVGYAVGLALPMTRGLFMDVRYETTSAKSALYLALLAVPLGTVVFEEVAFRGVMWGLLDASAGGAWATAVTSGLFGLWHILPALDMARANRLSGNEPSRGATVRLVVGTVLFTAAAGVVFALLRQWSGSLVAPALLHWATNGLGVLAAGLAWRISRD
jgi:membrane protease YdiL (CAAX protease family)